MYIDREIETTVDRMLQQDKVVLVTGARQVGKTTMLKHHLGDTFSYVSMENPRDYLQAKQDAVLFFETRSLPIIIDEVQ
jgi:predicted AAA+ superfamily ATPase